MLAVYCSGWSREWYQFGSLFLFHSHSTRCTASRMLRLRPSRSIRSPCANGLRMSPMHPTLPSYILYGRISFDSRTVISFSIFSSGFCGVFEAAARAGVPGFVAFLGIICVPRKTHLLTLLSSALSSSRSHLPETQVSLPVSPVSALSPVSHSIITPFHDLPGCPVFHQEVRPSGGRGSYAIFTMKSRGAMVPVVPAASFFLWIWSVQACTKRESPFSRVHSCEEPHAVEEDFRCVSLTPAHHLVVHPSLFPFSAP